LILGLVLFLILIQIPLVFFTFRDEFVQISDLKTQLKINDEASPIFVEIINKVNINQFIKNHIVKDNNILVEFGYLVIYFDREKSNYFQ